MKHVGIVSRHTTPLDAWERDKLYQLHVKDQVIARQAREGKDYTCILHRARARLRLMRRAPS